MQFICKFIENKRKELKITQERLSSGIFHYSKLSKIEKNTIYADKLEFDTLLQRLGVSQNFFEHYITLNEYEFQQLRFSILDEISNDNIEKAEHLIRKYREGFNGSQNVHIQYCEYAQILIYKKSNYDHKELINRYKKMISITIPNFEIVKLEDLLLSDWEVMFIIEYIQIIEEYDKNKAVIYYKEVYNYLKKNYIEGNIKAKFYPFVTLPIIEYLINNQNLNESLNMIEEVIKYLRKSFDLNNFTTILEQKIKVLKKLEISSDQNIISDWLDGLYKLYSEYNVNPNINKLNYQVFAWKNCYIINDVIRNRRIMLGISQMELADGICQPHTLSSIETHKSTPHPKNAHELLKKLNLSGQLYSFDICTTDYKTFDLVKNTNDNMSMCNFKIVKKNIKLLENRLDLDNKINLQYIKHKEILLKKMESKIDAHQCFEDLVNALEMTLPVNSFLESSSKFITHKELNIINNIIAYLNILGENDVVRKWLILLEKYCNFNKLQKYDSFINIFTKDSISSIYGNLSNFEKSNQILNEVIIDSFSSNLFWYLNNILYGVAWNYKADIEMTRHLSTIEQKKYTELLRTPYILSDIKCDEDAKKFILDQKI